MEEGDSETKYKYIPYATTIALKSLHKFPNVEYFFENLLKNIDINCKSVGSYYSYNTDIERNKYYSAYGIFMDYFVKKHLSNQFSIELTDDITEHILEKPDDYIILSEKKSLYDAIKKHYEIYKDTNTKAMDIIRSIKVVSFSRIIYFNEAVPKYEYTVNEDNLFEVVQYFEELPYKSVILSPDLNCDYFEAVADIIFDNDVILEVKTSKYTWDLECNNEMLLGKFYQTIIYGFAYYKKTGIKVTNFKVYNPLLGNEYSIELNNIDFELFENVLKRDIAVYDRLQKISKEEMILDLSLFPGEEKLS